MTIPLTPNPNSGQPSGSGHAGSSSEQGPKTHTPGPWRCIAASHGYVIEADCYDVAVVRNIGNHNNAANARLIAAAPDLLEALQQCASFISGINGPDNWHVQFARAAIAKATGESA